MATNKRNTYVYGNTARNIDVRRELETAPSGKMLKEVRAEQIKRNKMSMSPVFALFFVAALFVLGSTIVTNLGLQSDITNLCEDVSIYEARANTLALENDDEYSKMIESIDYEEIKRSAIEDLGMVYPSQDQIIVYTRENSDYVRQVNDLTN